MDQEAVIDTMRKRHSIRTYESTNINENDYEKINTYLAKQSEYAVPFGKKSRIELVPVTNNVSGNGIKLGTYGFVKNPSAYLVGIAENDKYSLIDFAYTFQKLVLYLTELNIGTCWMGGTFNRTSFAKEISLREEEFIPCISPIGYPNKKPRMMDKAVRFVAKADNRKPWDQLFYNGSFQNPLVKDKAGLLETPIEMVRLGPSASNKQPWRLIISDDHQITHFFIEHTPNYSSKLGYDMQMLDMGIAICHFDLAVKALNIAGTWEIEEPKIDLSNKQMEYIASWKLGKES